MLVSRAQACSMPNSTTPIPSSVTAAENAVIAALDSAISSAQGAVNSLMTRSPLDFPYGSNFQNDVALSNAQYGYPATVPAGSVVPSAIPFSNANPPGSTVPLLGGGPVSGGWWGGMPPGYYTGRRRQVSNLPQRLSRRAIPNQSAGAGPGGSGSWSDQGRMMRGVPGGSFGRRAGYAPGVNSGAQGGPGSGGGGQWGGASGSGNGAAWQNGGNGAPGAPGSQNGGAASGSTGTQPGFVGQGEQCAPPSPGVELVNMPQSSVSQAPILVQPPVLIADSMSTPPPVVQPKTAGAPLCPQPSGNICLDIRNGFVQASQVPISVLLACSQKGYAGNCPPPACYQNPGGQINVSDAQLAAVPMVDSSMLGACGGGLSGLRGPYPISCSPSDPAGAAQDAAASAGMPWWLWLVLGGALIYGLMDEDKTAKKPGKKRVRRTA